MITNEDEIKELEERLGTGDAEALARLFSMFRARLKRIVEFRISRRLRSRLEPEDILQDAYLAATARIKRFGQDGFGSSFIWLRLIVNQCLVEAHRRHLGAKARDARREVDLFGVVYPQASSVSMAIHLVGDDTSPSQVAARHEMIEKVGQAITAMDEIDQEILALRHFEELTNKETAEALGIEQKAASIRYVRALKRLKESLAGISGFVGRVL